MGKFAKHIIENLVLIISISVCLIVIPSVSRAAKKVIIAPIIGNSQYPEVIKGIRFVLMSDLEFANKAEVVSASSTKEIFDYKGNLTVSIKDISKKIYADVLIKMSVNENNDEFDMIVRAYGLKNGYNIGSEKIRGEYKFIKAFQNRLAEVVCSFLYVSLSSEELGKISQGHTNNLSAVKNYADAYEKWEHGKWVGAAESFSKASQIDTRFGLATNFSMASSKRAVGKAKGPSEKGRALELMGRIDEAYAEYEKVLKKNPNDAKALAGQGRILMSKNQKNLAMAKFSKASRIAPNDAEVLIDSAKASMAMNRTEIAYKQFQRAKQLGVDSYEMHDSLGRIYIKRGQKDKASKEFLAAGNIFEKDLNYGKAQQYFKKANNAQKTIEGLRSEAKLYSRQKEYQIAIGILKKAIFIDPANDGIQADMGHIHYQSGQYLKSFDRFMKAYNLNNKNYQANLYLGIIYYKIKDDPKVATTYLKNAIKVSPDNQEAYSHLSEIYMQTNRINEAILLVNDLIKQHPKDPRYQVDLGNLYMRSEDLDRAIEAYSKAVELRSDYVAALEKLGLAYKMRGQTEEVLEIIEKLYSIDASNNIIVKGSTDILSGLTRTEFLGYVKSFPKTYETALIDKIYINNVSPIYLETEAYKLEDFLEMLKPYRINTTKIMDDIELALFNQYRVIRSKNVRKKLGDSINDNEYLDDQAIQFRTSSASLDGIFGFKVKGYKKDKVSTNVMIDMSLVTSLEVKRFGHEQAIPVKYLTQEIFVLNKQAFFLYALLFIIFGIPFFYLTFYRSWKRGWGKLLVKINYDAQKESFLTLKLSTSEIKDKERLIEIVTDKQKHQKEKYRRQLRQTGSLVRNMVGRETMFERVPAKMYFCYLYGTIEDVGVTKKTVGKYSMMQKIKIVKNQQQEIFFQLEKEEAFIRVFVNKGELEFSGIELRIDGIQDVRYSKAGVGANFYLKTGNYVLRGTHEGKQFSRAINITNLDDRDIFIDLLEDELALEAETNHEAVAEQMIAQGDLEGAAELYKKHGDNDKADKLLGQVHVRHNVDEKAAQVYLENKEYKKAADVYGQLGEPEKANHMMGLHYLSEENYERALECLKDSGNHKVLARIYEKLGKNNEMHESMAIHFMDQGQNVEAALEFAKAKRFAQAGELYEKIGDPLKAAYMHAKDGNYALVGELFARAGEKRRAAVAFEKAGQYDSALVFFKEIGEKSKVAELLVKQNKHLEAAVEFKDQGLYDEAISVCQQIPENHEDYYPAYSLLGQIFSLKGIDDLAINSFERVFSKDPKLLGKEQLYEYGILLEKTSNFRKSLLVFEILMQIDLHYQDTAQKVKSLKSKASQESTKAQIEGVSPPVKGQQGAIRYEMIEELGRGAMGIVYKAKDTLLDRVVAFKTLPAVLKNDPGALESLLREAKTAAKLSHPNIVTVFDVGQENGVYYITMEYVQGKTLQQILQKVRRVNLENFLNVAVPLCDVLSYAHSKQVIHRDVKPSNVILFPNKGVKLMDFGIAKVLQQGGKDQTMMRGTPLYMAPEQIMGEGVDHRTDLYALGVTFYEMLSGMPPFTEGDVMYAHVHRAPKPVDEIVPGLDPRISTVVMRCLNKDKNARFNSSEEIKSVLSRLTV